MKKLFLSFIFCIIAIVLFSQNPQGFNYQAVVRDASGTVVTNQQVRFKISLIPGAAGNQAEYVETHFVSTNDFGLVNLVIGSGFVEIGNFDNINWGNENYYLNLAIDITGGYVYTEMGTSQLLSVPYALYAKESGSSSGANGTVTSIATTNGITGGPITEDGTIGLTGQASALHNLSTNGIIVRTGSETVTAREITAGQGITVNDGDGINGNPEININFGTTTGTVAEGNHTHTGISPAGNTGHIQFNNAGVFGSSPDLYWDIDNARMGLGIDNPEGRMVVKQSSTAQAEEPLFEVKNKAGQTVFVIYEDSVRIYINDDPDKASKGTFAVSGRNTTKNYTGDILYVSPDSTRVFIGDDITKASKGTFAVSGRNTTKFETNQFLRIGRESARIYVEDNVASGERGGFAVGGLTSLNNDDAINFMYLTPNNYFIGHESGDKTTPGIGSIGKYNTFFGYQSGKENEIGHSNVFIGFKSGFNNNSGDNNSFVGNQAGFNNTGGSSNTFMGHECGYSNTTGNYNAFYGYKAGKSNTAGNSNLFIGNESGHDNISGSNNTFVGNKTGLKNNANQNTFIGTNTGTNTTTGGYNVFIGTFSGSANTEGSSNVFIGNLAGSSNTTAAANTYIGANAGHWKKEGRFNTYVGCQAGFGNGNVEGEFNVAIGWRAGMNIAGDNNVFIGTQAGLTETGSNKLYISNSNSNTLIYGDFETDSLVFNSSINVKKATHLPISTVSSSTTLNNGHHTVLVNTGVATITLPPASNSVGRIYIIKKIAATAGIITIDANLSETIDGTLTKSISAQWESITIQSNGSEWFIL